MCSRPTFRRSTNLARSKIRMCLETELSEIGNGAARSVTRASDRASRRKMARRVGSARACSVASSNRVCEFAVIIHPYG